MLDVIVIGAGPAAVVAALRAGDLGAKTVLVTRELFGGMAANDGPVPVRTLAHAARLMRDARQLSRYGLMSASRSWIRAFARAREVAAVAMAGGMRVDDLAHVPLSFPTYAGVLGRVAANATRQLNLTRYQAF